MNTNSYSKQMAVSSKQMNTNSYKNLLVWQKSIELVKLVYLMTDQLPEQEKFGLSSQMRRSAISIPSNIAEGYRRRHNKEFIRFLQISDGSASELETQVIISKEIYSHINIEKVQSLLEEVQKMTAKLIISVENRK